MFERRKRKKAAERRYHEAIAAEWARHGVRPRDSTGPASREALREAGLTLGSPDYTELVFEVMRAANERLSPEDLHIVTGGSEGRGPSN